MRTPLARIFSGWLLMLAGGFLLIESGLHSVPGHNRSLAAIVALAGFGMIAGGMLLRRAAVKSSR